MNQVNTLLALGSVVGREDICLSIVDIKFNPQGHVRCQKAPTAKKRLREKSLREVPAQNRVFVRVYKPPRLQAPADSAGG